MRSTIHDASALQLLQLQLKTAKLSWLELKPHRDYDIGKHKIAVYHGTLSKHTPDELYVIDAWLICSGTITAFYNRDNYPNAIDAVAQHIGRLAIEGTVKIVEARNGTRRRGNSEPPKQGEAK